MIWGENDTEAPLRDAKDLEKIMLDGALIVLPGTHYAYLENLGRVLSILDTFIEGDEENVNYLWNIIITYCLRCSVRFKKIITHVTTKFI